MPNLSPAKAGSGSFKERDPRIALAALAHPGLSSAAASRLVDAEVHVESLVQAEIHVESLPMLRSKSSLYSADVRSESLSSGRAPWGLGEFPYLSASLFRAQVICVL